MEPTARAPGALESELATMAEVRAEWEAGNFNLALVLLAETRPQLAGMMRRYIVAVAGGAEPSELAADMVRRFGPAPYDEATAIEAADWLESRP